MTYLDPRVIDFDNFEFKVTGEYVVADGDSTYQVEVTVKDTTGKPMTDIDKVELVAVDPEGKAVISFVDKTEDGVHVFTVSSTDIGEVSLQGKIEEEKSKNNVTLKFYVADFVDLDLCEFTVDKNTILADGEEFATATIKLFLNKREPEEELRPANVGDNVKLIVPDGGIIAETELESHVDNVYKFKIRSVVVGQETIHFEIINA